LLKERTRPAGRVPFYEGRSFLLRLLFLVKFAHQIFFHRPLTVRDALHPAQQKQRQSCASLPLFLFEG